jgi:hypothetical protein
LKFSAGGAAGADAAADAAAVTSRGNVLVGQEQVLAAKFSLIAPLTRCKVDVASREIYTCTTRAPDQRTSCLSEVRWFN